MDIRNKDNNDPVKNEKKSLANYARYTGLGFQMIAVIGVFTFIGYKLDQWQETSQPIFTAILSLVGVCAALYQVIRSLKNMNS